MGKEQIITMAQANEAVETLKKYYQQRKAEGEKSGSEDVSCLLILMQAGLHHVSSVAGTMGNLTALLVSVMSGNPNVQTVLERALQFMQDDGSLARAINEQAKKLFGPKVMN